MANLFDCYYTVTPAVLRWEVRDVTNIHVTRVL
jgi:hypothetical protein